MGIADIFCTTSSPSRADRVSWIYCDISDRQWVFQTFEEIRPNYVFHFAALGTKNTQSQYPLWELFKVNTLGTQNLIDAAISTWVCESFLNISSAYEFGPHNFPIDESVAFSPEGNYAISKLWGSLYLDDKIHNENFPWITYRLFSVYWSGDSGRIIPLIVDAFLTGKELRLFDIYRKRDFVHIDTVISAILTLDKIQKNNINSINIWSGESLDIYELVEKISRILDLPIPSTIIFEASTVPENHWQCDNSLLKNYIKPISLSEWLTQVINN